MSYKSHFSRFLSAIPDRLHFAAHSHHCWPDVTFGAQQKSWLDAARFVDQKWAHILGNMLPVAQQHIARILNLPDPSTIAFEPNLHAFLVRLLSCLESPVSILTTSSEFHSFNRQIQRMEEAGQVQVIRVPVEPFETFLERMTQAVRKQDYDLFYISQVFYDSGFVVPELTELIRAVPNPDALVVVDGYHGFMARPTDWSSVAHRAFYMSGGYKYAMSGEGLCFMHCPPGYGSRPVNTGWFAAFGALEALQDADTVPFSTDGFRFWGGTFNPSGLYRFNAVMDWMKGLGLTVSDIHGHVQTLQARFLEQLDALRLNDLHRRHLIPPRTIAERGNFFTFRHHHAGEIHAALMAANIITDYRADRLRIGFGLYQDLDDVDRLCTRISAIKVQSDLLTPSP